MGRKNRHRIRPTRRSKGLGRKFLLTLLFLLCAAVAIAGFFLLERANPEITLGKDIAFLSGGPMRVPLLASDKMSGIRKIDISLAQNGKLIQLYHREFPRQAWLSKAGPAEIKETITLDGVKKGAQDGPAELVVTIHDFSLNNMLKGNSTVHQFPVKVDSKPPMVTVEHAQLYITPGGSGIVVYNISEKAVRHGVMIDDVFFQGFPLANSDKRFISYIALNWDSKKPVDTRIIAVDPAGNEGKGLFSMHFKKAREKKDRINIPDSFLKKKIPEFQQHNPELSGSNIEKFIQVNNAVRVANALQIAEIAANTVSEQLWRDKFIRMPGAGKAGFAEQRTYFYQNKAIDHQTHLGMDIASTARVAIKAANSGRVIFADYIGIYGNTVILDHGQGLASLYSHLSRIDTSIDTMVQKDELIGRSGTTGMAGGDHLHFSMLVHGIFVTPVEWWDQHWIDVNINNIIDE